MGDPDCYEGKCPICTRARDSNRLPQFVQAIEMLVTFGGCPQGAGQTTEVWCSPK
jgi:hypothetical protein